jgi:hypothetical protein
MGAGLQAVQQVVASLQERTLRPLPTSASTHALACARAVACMCLDGGQCGCSRAGMGRVKYSRVRSVSR